MKQQTEIVQDQREADPPQSSLGSLGSRLIQKATSVLRPSDDLRPSDEPLLVPPRNTEDELELSDDDMLCLGAGDGVRRDFLSVGKKFPFVLFILV